MDKSSMLFFMKMGHAALMDKNLAVMEANAAKLTEALELAIARLETQPALQYPPPAPPIDDEADAVIDKVMRECQPVRAKKITPKPESREIHIVCDPKFSEDGMSGEYAGTETPDGKRISVGEWRQVGEHWHLILNVTDQIKGK